MKRTLLISIMVLFGAVIAHGQNNEKEEKNRLLKGTWLVEGNTGLGAVQPANTSFSLSWVNGLVAWNIGLEGGYFLVDRLAIKAGLGYGNNKTISLAPISGGGGEGSEGGGNEGGNEGGGEGGGSGTLSYKFGAKYYFLDMIPLQVDFSGTNVRDGERYLGFQGGYAFFLGKNVSIEPGFRYDISLNNNLVKYENAFQFNVGFALQF